jgi:RimJ/RimL family protein N-acetyltransferase
MLETSRLRLRSWRTSDATAYAAACNTPPVMRWLGGVQSGRALKQDIRFFRQMEANDGFTFWALELREGGGLLGFCGLLRITERDCPFAGAVEIGWRVSEREWRKGYAFEAAERVLSFGFNELDLSEIVSRAAVGNAASRGLMEKLGMRRLRELDYVPKFEVAPLAVYSIGKESALGTAATAPRTVSLLKS